MNQWAALAYDDEPQQADDGIQFDDELINELIVPGPAKRNRGRKLKRTPGQVAQLIRSDFLKNKRRRRERAKIAASTVPTHILKHRKTARSRAGAPRADIRREALVFLGLVYREFTKKVPTLSQRVQTPFHLFAVESFRAIGLDAPALKHADFAHDLKHKYNKELLSKWLFFPAITN